MTNKEIIQFLTSTTVNAGFVDKLKIKYRPIICPFNDLLKYATNKNSVFDIGCGSGQFCALIANYTDVKTIKGIEINNRLITNANQVNKRFADNKTMFFEVFDGKHIPDDICNYDLIYMIDVFHHIPKNIRESFLIQLYAKMKVGAQLMFKDIDAASPLVICNKMHDLVFSKEIGNEISLTSAENTLKNLGFSVIESYKKTVWFYPHYFILVQK